MKDLTQLQKRKIKSNIPISFNYFTYNVCIYPNVWTCDCF